MISRIGAAEVIASCRQTLGLPDEQNTEIDDALLAALMRRSAGIHCPCSRATLRASLLECTDGLPASYESRSDAVDEAIDALIVGGDLLELNDVIVDDINVKQTWVFAAPPQFVVRASGSTFLLGIVPDQDTFLPSTLSSRVVELGFTRVLEPRVGEDLRDELRELGLQEISEPAWLKSPRPENPETMLDHYKRLVDAQAPATGIRDLRVLDAAQPVTYYRGRWVDRVDKDGIFVARRPQEFGAPIWCLVRLQNGNALRLLDLPLAHSRWRACDSAWHIQMAIDHCAGTPQRYRRRRNGNAAQFDFFSPLPQWSQRRLMILGKPVPRDGCLLSYAIPANEADVEEAFLQQNLWLVRDDNPN